MRNFFAMLFISLISCKPALPDISEAVSGGICTRIPADLSAIDISCKKTIKIDFTRNTICVLNEASKKQFVRIENYQLVPSVWKAKNLYLIIEIDGRPERFRFDPRLEGAVGMPQPRQVKFSGMEFPALACTKDDHFRIGMEVIFCFDWIIDSKNKEVYVHKNYNHLPIPETAGPLTVNEKQETQFIRDDS